MDETGYSTILVVTTTERGRDSAFERTRCLLFLGWVLLPILVVVVSLSGSIVVGYLTGVHTLKMSASALVRNDIRADTIKVREAMILPASQTSTKGAIAYNGASNSITYSNGITSFDVGSNLPGSVLTFRPGYTGSSLSIFSDWSELCLRLAAIDGPKTIYFDNSMLAESDTPMVIPAGHWDMPDVMWWRPISGLQTDPAFVQITVTDGATLNGLCGIDGPMEVTYDSATQTAISAVYTDDSRSTGFLLANYAKIVTDGVQAFLQVNSTGTFHIVLKDSATAGSGANPVFESLDGLMQVDLFSRSVLAAGSLSGTGDVQIIPYTPDNTVTVPISFPAVLGSLTYITNFISGCPNTYQRAAVPGISDDAADGYKIGDIWIDTVGSNVYIAAVVTNGAATWRGPL